MKNILSFKIDQKSYFNIFSQQALILGCFTKELWYMKPLPLCQRHTKQHHSRQVTENHTLLFGSSRYFWEAS